MGIVKLSVTLSNDELTAAISEYLCRKLCAAVIVDSCVPASGGVTAYATITKEKGGCRNCGQKGHYEKTCPVLQKSAVVEADEPVPQ